MTSTRKYVGEKIRLYRKQKGLTQEQLAANANMGNYHISRIELGKENVCIDTLDKISQALGLKTVDLFKDAP